MKLNAMPLMESDAKRSERISAESEKVLVSTSAPSPSGSKGLKEFFRRRQKSTGSTPSGVDLAAGDGNFLQSIAKTDSSVQPHKSNEAACVSSYGNYLTISGTGANVLRDLFNRKYRSSARSSYAVHDGEPKFGSRKGVQGQLPLFRFRSKKDSIQEEERSPSPEVESSSKSDLKGAKAGSRARHISGPVISLYGTGIDRDPKFRQSLRSGSSGNAPGTRIKTFFDSFRQRSRTVSQDSSNDECIGSLLEDNRQSFKLSSSKKKKFKVTPAFQPSANRGVDDQQIGPDEFLRLYRSRANSDPKPEVVVDEAGNVRSRLSSASPSISKASTVHSYEPQQFVIWRDRKTGTRLFRLPKRYTENFGLDNVAGGNSEELVYAKFMSSHLCYDVMPSSSKLVIFDTQLSVKKAFFALIYNGVRSAPLWDTQRQDFVGMLTITDFIQMLQKYYRSPQEQMEELEEHVISTWKEVLHGYDRPMVVIEPDENLLAAIRSLSNNKVHRLLVIDRETGNALHVLTLKRILRYLLSHVDTLRHPEFMHQTLQQLEIGSYENIASATPDMPLIEALNMFVERRISALPIVNGEGKVVDIYTKFDILGLAAEKAYYNLDVTITEALKNRREEFEGVVTCVVTERLLDILKHIVTAEVHRIVVVDENHFLKGVVSLSDILDYLVLRPVERQKIRLAEQETMQKGRRDEEPGQDDLNLDGLALMLQSGSAVGPDLALEPDLAEAPESIVNKDAEEQITEQRDRLDITSQIPNGAEP